MAFYEMKEMPDINKTGERILYPRLAIVSQTSTEELVREITSGSSFTPGDVEGLLVQLSVEIARQLSQGRSVKLDGIGVFTPSLALREGKEREEATEEGERRNAQSIMVGNVNFRVDKSLLRSVNGRCRLERAPWKSGRSSRKFTEEQRQALAVKYLEEHPYLTVADYRTLTGLLHTTAANELRKWAKQPDSKIDTSGRATHRVYVLRQEVRSTVDR